MSTVILHWYLLFSCVFFYWFKLLESAKTAVMKLQAFNCKTVSQVQCRTGVLHTTNTLSRFHLSLIAICKYTSCHQLFKQKKVLFEIFDWVLNTSL